MRVAHLATVICLPVLICLTGCLGYQRGTLAHPDLHTIAIGQIANKSNSPRLATYLRQHLAEELTRDGSLRLVVNEGDADCVLVAEIGGFDTRGIAETKVPSVDKDQRINRSTAFATDVKVTWHLDLVNGSKPLLKPQTTVGRAVFNEQYDLTSAREEGVRQAMHDAAKQIVSDITEGW